MMLMIKFQSLRGTATKSQRSDTAWPAIVPPVPYVPVNRTQWPWKVAGAGSQVMVTTPVTGLTLTSSVDGILPTVQGEPCSAARLAAPGSPLAPVGPVPPVAPVDPVGPVAPVSPVDPVSPLGPV